MSNPRIAFIGCGNIAHVHMRFLKKAGYAAGATCDISEVRAKEFAKTYGIDSSNAYTDLQEMLESFKPEVVHVLTPPQYHFEIARKCIQHGVNVLVEKPLCENAEQMDTLLELAEHHDVSLSVDHTRVYNPMVAKARDFIATGKYGAIVSMEYEYDDPNVIRDAAGDLLYAKGSLPWFQSLVGGVAHDLIPHPFSVLLSFAPDLELDDVWGRSSNGIVEETVMRMTGDDCFALIKLSMRLRPLRNTLKIYCEKGSIFVDLRNLLTIYLPEHDVPNIVGRVLYSLSYSTQMFFKFVLAIFKILLGRVHAYSGMEHLFTAYYDSLRVKDRREIPHINMRKTVIYTEQALNALVPPDQQPDAVEGRLKERLASRFELPADVLVTGATGFVGKYLVRDLQSLGLNVRGFCRSLHAADRLNEQTGIAIGNMRSVESLKSAMKGTSTVYHVAAAMGGDWAEFHESTVAGTENLLRAFAESDADRLIYVSSLGILDYGHLQNNQTVNEQSGVDERVDIRGHYTRAKKLAEDLVWRFIEEHPQKRITIVRPGLVYGRESNNNLANAGIKIGKFLFVFGLGNRFFGLNYVENLSHTLSRLGLSETHIEGNLLHVTDDDQPTVREYVKKHNELTNERVIPLYLPVWCYRLLFGMVDTLMTVKTKRNPHFGYRFNSNSKRLLYDNTFLNNFRELKNIHTFDAAMQRTLN